MSARQLYKGQKGFTIIEVVLVLAIAGLLFLMVFFAWPALQASERDGARKKDVSAISAAITQYSGNNRGAFPTTAQLTGNSDGTPATDGRFAGYLSAVSTNLNKVTVETAGLSAVTITAGHAKVVRATACGSSGAATNDTATQALTSSNNRAFTITTFIEAGGGTSYCQDS